MTFPSPLRPNALQGPFYENSGPKTTRAGAQACYVMLCCVVLCSVLFCSVLMCCVMLCCVLLCVVLFCVVLSGVIFCMLCAVLC